MTISPMLLLIEANKARQHEGGTNITLDVAAIITALFWPTILFLVFYNYRESLPGLLEGLLSRIKKFEFAGLSIEVAEAKAFHPAWSESVNAQDLRHKAASVQVNDSTAATFINQFRDGARGDYAEINLGEGMEWLTSRLFIMAILFGRMKGIRAFVFLETAGTVRKKFVCWA